MLGKGLTALAAAAARQPRVPLALAVTTLLCVVGAAWLPSAEHSGDTVLWLAAAFAPYAVLVARDEPGLDARLALLLAGACVLCLIAPAPPLSDDVYRFLWDGRVLRHGLDPYRYAPHDPALYDLRDAPFAHINHPDIPTIYPPLAQLAFALLGALWHDPRVMKLAAGLCVLAVGYALHRHGQPRATVWLVLNPLVLSESALNGHLDIAVGGSLLLSMLAIQAGRPWRAALWLSAATGLKMVGLALAPLAGVHRRAAAAFAFALCVAVLLPQLWPRGETLGGAGQYARRWQGNEGGFALVQGAFEGLLAPLASPSDRARGHLRLPSLRPLMERLEGSALDPWRGAVGEGKSVPDRTDFQTTWLAGLFARLAVTTLIGSLALAAFLRRAPPLHAARWILLSVLWFAPQVHPWYLMWVLPLECAAGGVVALVWSALILVAYAPLELWLSQRLWLASSLIQALEYATVGLVMACEPWMRPAPTQGNLGLTPPRPPVI